MEMYHVSTTYEIRLTESEDDIILDRTWSDTGYEFIPLIEGLLGVNYAEIAYDMVVVNVNQAYDTKILRNLIFRIVQAEVDKGYLSDAEL